MKKGHTVWYTVADTFARSTPLPTEDTRFYVPHFSFPFSWLYVIRTPHKDTVSVPKMSMCWFAVHKVFTWFARPNLPCYCTNGTCMQYCHSSKRLSHLWLHFRNMFALPWYAPCMSSCQTMIL
jgi:hypothetical protein